ncbi:hypothetical protein MCUN1_001395 [Malassezia cuniculi]|uniref:Cytochrome c oxidase assembly factor 3 n=1 Tax=Malassezia cuniculi TaxID=948313 RepID=A0AAF0ESZ3_9BASI|nr:hypothetical protein MCUN1_001395 [Malassezia cuniculi]
MRYATRPAVRMYSTNMREINAAQRSYRPKGYEASAGFRRARQQYVVSNFVLGSAIAAFVVGVFTYTIYKVDQDDFSDIESVRVDPAAVFGEKKLSPEIVTEAKEELKEELKKDVRVAESRISRAWNKTLSVVGLGPKQVTQETPVMMEKSPLGVQTNKHAI